MVIQLLEGHDPSAELDRSVIGRWEEYVESYVLRQPTEWVPEQREEGRSAVFLRRWVCWSGTFADLTELKIGRCQRRKRWWDGMR